MEFIVQKVIRAFHKVRSDFTDIKNLLSGIRDGIQQQTDAIRSAQKSGDDKQHVEPVWLNKVLAKYDEAERDKSSKDDRHYRIQNSIRWAAWCTFFAAFFYGAVAFYQWRELRNTRIASTRAWVGIMYPVEVTA